MHSLIAFLQDAQQVGSLTQIILTEGLGGGFLIRLRRVESLILVVVLDLGGAVVPRPNPLTLKLLLGP